LLSFLFVEPDNTPLVHRFPSLDRNSFHWKEGSRICEPQKPRLTLH
jgi:hypothetical protein